MNSNNRGDVMKKAATEWPGTGILLGNKEDGRYVCGQCGVELFKSDQKYDSGSGWPAFSKAAASDAIELREDTSQNTVRTEAICRRCGGHLGHLFEDASRDSGKRYCINSASLDFESSDGGTVIRGDGRSNV